MPCQIKRLSEETHAAWDHYVEQAPNATFFHRSAWQRILQETFGHYPHYHYAERDGEICGVLPLFFIKSRLFGNRLCSIPFGVAGAPISNSSEIGALLDDTSLTLLAETGADHIEYRDTQQQRTGWVSQSDLYATFAQEMEPDAEKQLTKIPRKQRAVLRKALKNEALTWSLDEHIEDLYALYALSVRNLGTPVFPARYFRNLRQAFAEDCEILTVRSDGKPISSVLSFYFRDRVMPYYTGCLPEARALGTNDLMYWQVMRRAVERGCRVFDFGRSKVGTGPYDFKRNWGFDPKPVTHQYYLRAGGELPRLNPTNPKYRAFIQLWRRLPLPVANTLGPILVRGIG